VTSMVGGDLVPRPVTGVWRIAGCWQLTEREDLDFYGHTDPARASNARPYTEAGREVGRVLLLQAHTEFPWRH
jgi:hypothetical protein